MALGHGPKRVAGLQDDYFFVYWDYRCNKKECNKKLSGIYPEFFDMLPEFVRLIFPAFVHNGTLIDKSVSG